MKIPIAYITETYDGRRIYWKGYFGELGSMHPWKDTEGHMFHPGIRIRGGLKKIYLKQRWF